MRKISIAPASSITNHILDTSREVAYDAKPLDIQMQIANKFLCVGEHTLFLELKLGCFDSFLNLTEFRLNLID